MGPVEIDLRAITRGTVTAPAGCGKTQLIAHALAGHRGSKPILVLTHTNAGVAALRGRLDRAGVPHSAYRLSTIDGWAIRLIASFPGRSGHNPDILRLATPARDYPAIREAAWRLLQTGHVSEVLKASYTQLIVDEYQDCSVPQHYIVYFLSLILPTCVLGDPMQAIFGFRGNALADWNQQVCAHFPVVAELATPWRWRNAGSEALGLWLLEARRLLAAGQQVDLRSGPAGHVTWIQVTPPNDHAQRLVAARTPSPTPDGCVLLIADSRNRAIQHNFASHTPGASTVEAVDLQDLIAFGSSFDMASPDAPGTAPDTGAGRHDQRRCTRAHTASGFVSARNRQESAVRSGEQRLGIPARTVYCCRRYAVVGPARHAECTRTPARHSLRRAQGIARGRARNRTAGGDRQACAGRKTTVGPTAAQACSGQHSTT